MTREEVERAVIEMLRELQELSGDADPVITKDTQPLKDLAGFDSHRDLEFTVTLAAWLSVDGETRWCLAPDGKRPLTVKEIVDRLMENLRN